METVQITPDIRIEHFMHGAVWVAKNRMGTQLGYVHTLGANPIVWVFVPSGNYIPLWVVKRIESYLNAREAMEQ